MKSQADLRWNELRKDWSRGVFESELRIAIFAAHPDDETIGASALLARCTEPLVIFLTDGAPEDSQLWPRDFRGSREEYALCRCQEAEAALAFAGISQGQIKWLGAVDQEAIFHAARLTETLVRIVVEPRLDILVTHPYEGGHPDHDAAALIANMAIARLPRLLCLEMSSYHARGDRCESGEFLNADLGSEFVFELSKDEIARKRQMFNAYGSQTLVLGNFSVDREKLRLAPAYNFANPPQEGKPWYEQLGWPMTAGRWRTLADNALRSAQVIHAADRA